MNLHAMASIQCLILYNQDNITIWYKVLVVAKGNELVRWLKVLLHLVVYSQQKVMAGNGPTWIKTKLIYLFP
jgi:hypothetical protein